MSRTTFRLLLLGLAMLSALPAPAAEIQLRARAAPSGGLVRLADLAEVFAADEDEADDLAATELFPAPAQGTKRFVRVSDVQEALAARGVNLARHTFSGAALVELQTAAPAADRPAPSARRRDLTISQQARAERAARDAILRHLRETADEDAAWAVEVELSGEQTRAVIECGGKPAARGGEAPWTGEQEFELSLPGEKPVTLKVTARVSLPPSIVVAKVALPRGAIIGPDDVELLPVVEGARDGEFFSALDEVLGQETTQALAAGQALSARSIRAPLLVHRGEAITVYARGDGVRVRTVARAREDGAEGDVITVESMSDRKTYLARVTGVQEVEAQGRGTEAREERTAGRRPCRR